MPGPVDLHIHSCNSSDGDFTPFHLVRLAHEQGFAAISISDHDTTAAYPETLQHGEKMGVEIIPGVELTTLFDKREFHLLLPFIDWQSKVLSDLVARVAQGRILEAKARVARLQELGFDLQWEEVRKASAPFSPLGVTIAQVLLKKGKEAEDASLAKYFSSENRMSAPYTFYKDYFAEGKPAFVPRQNIALLEVLKIAPETGGVPVLAHPGAPFQQVTRTDLSILRKHGLEGLEVFTTYHDEDQTQQYRAWATDFDLVPTAGSDFHGSIKPHIPFGRIKDGDMFMVEKLKQRRP
jgi:predicted metal-dependent phosphoesterase TrpH